MGGGQDLQTVHIGQTQVQHDQLHAPRGEQPERLGTGTGRVHRVAGPLKIPADQLPQLPVVLDHQYRAGHVLQPPSRRGYRAGAARCWSAILARTSSMSRPRTASMTCSSAAAGSAPGWEKTRMPSRNAISVGIEKIRSAAARACSASVSTLPNTMSGCFRLACSYTGAKRRHGPHQPAQKSTSTIPSPVTVCSKVSLVSATVVIACLRLVKVPGSGQGQEQLLQARDSRRLVCPGRLGSVAVPQPVGKDHETGAVEGVGHRDELGEHVHAVAARFEHRDHAAELALGPVQPSHDIAQHVLVDLHDAPPHSPVSSNPTYPGGYRAGRAEWPVRVPGDWVDSIGGRRAMVDDRYPGGYLSLEVVRDARSRPGHVPPHTATAPW